VVHVTWQGIPQPNSRNTTETITTTLQSVCSSPPIEFGPVSTDAGGTYTLPLGGVPNGTYYIRAKGPRNLSSGSGTLDTITLAGGPVTNVDLGTMRAGDALSTGATNFNVVNSSDFSTFKFTFGKAYGQVGYDARIDFDNTDVVSSPDFTL